MPASDDTEPPAVPRQRIERVRGARRAKLTPVEGTITDVVDGDDVPDAVARTASGTPGPNDEQLRRDVPPHY